VKRILGAVAEIWPWRIDQISVIANASEFGGEANELELLSDQEEPLDR
jgi:hypothetical protein